MLPITPIQVDLRLSKIVTDTNPSVGHLITFTITISNIGPANATDIAGETIDTYMVTFSDTLTGLAIDPLLPGGGPFDGNHTLYLPIILKLASNQ